MALTLSRIDRVERIYTVGALLPNGDPATVTAVHFAVVPPRAGVDGETDWTSFPVVDGQVAVVYTAPEADAEVGDLLVPAGGGDAHAKDVDGTFVKAVRVERISVG